MLSILIPVYNCNVTKLVKNLHKQCTKSKVPFEILCFDDGSRSNIKSKNTRLSSVFGVNYTELSENLGRARIRNWLAKSASFENLLYLDCDSKVIHKHFIKDYLKCIYEGYEIVSGGRVYNKKPPRAKSKKLHWLYGTKKESKSARFRKVNPRLYFHSNNFLVTRDIILKCPFDESVVGYGYEDLIWAENAYEKGYLISHIDNPTEHLGLEKNKVFIDKTKRSIQNLIEYNKYHAPLKTNLIIWNERLKKWKLHSILINKIIKNREAIEKNLMSENPKLINLDLLKLLIYHDVLNN